MKVLFVCTGNTCRSPMAEGYFNHLIQQAGIPWLSCASAGVFAEDGAPPSPQAVKVMETLNIDIAKHESAPLTAESAETAELIVTMTQSHKSAAGTMFPQTYKKIKTLSQYSGGDTYRDIADPFGGTVGEYQACFEEMRRPLENLFLELLSEHKKQNVN